MALPFFGIGMKTDLFQSCGHCWVFQICWHIECSTFTASSFMIWKSSTGILPPPLALFVVMLSKAHLTSHSDNKDQKFIGVLWKLNCPMNVEFEHSTWHIFLEIYLLLLFSSLQSSPSLLLWLFHLFLHCKIMLSNLSR